MISHKELESKLLVTMAMLSAASALTLEGRSSLEEICDPYGDGPFNYQESGGGYTLTSQLVIDDEAVSMAFGPGSIPAVNKKSRLLVYNPKSDPTQEIRQALEAARIENKRVLVQWGFNGCIPCYKLHRVFEETEPLANILRKSFVQTLMDVTNKKSKPLLRKYTVDMPGVPHLTVLDAEGHVLENVKPTQQFYSSGSFDTDLLQGFLERWA
jgi:thioredoxin-related protein